MTGVTHMGDLPARAHQALVDALLTLAHQAREQLQTGALLGDLVGLVQVGSDDGAAVLPRAVAADHLDATGSVAAALALPCTRAALLVLVLVLDAGTVVATEVYVGEMSAGGAA